MTRPNIVRADTIDLQDPGNPSAAEHSKRPAQGTLAPHQASQVHHVIEERHSEEQVLADAWRRTENLMEDPDAIEEAQLRQEDGHLGDAQDEDDGGEEHDADDDMMDRISSSPSIDDEDIDFEFVYALHTFVATVEGQANATKGDTMVLLDDSNSYWWLVRVVKDSSIGYLPAEHIETPTERLARLNKHRNIDLSATMLGDNSEKSRNPLKKAIRRRNAKTVQFAAPTYVEASDYDYDTDEDEQPLDPYASNTARQQEVQETTNDPQEEEPESAPEKPDDAPTEQEKKQSKRASFDREQAATASATIDDPQLSPRLVDKTEAAPLKSRKGTPRNTDSFLRDDSIETRKITLTPGLLREDNSSVKSNSSEAVRGNSLDALVKQVSPPDSAGKKDGKKEKKDQKKPSMLSGLFKSKKKEKKGKNDVGEASDTEKLSTELTRPDSNGATSTNNSSANNSNASSPINTRFQTPFGQQSTPVSRVPPGAAHWNAPRNTAAPPTEATAPREFAPSSGPTFYAELEGSSVVPEPVERASSRAGVDSGAEAKEKDNPLAPITNILRSVSSGGSKEPKPTKAKRSKQRVELGDFDPPSSDNDDDNNDSDGPSEVTESNNQTAINDRTVRDRTADVPDGVDKDATPTGPRSPQTTSHVAELEANRNPSLDSTVTSASSLLTPSHTSPSTASSHQPWSDSSLRNWLDDGSEVKDMLVMVHDKSGVVPVGNNHPLMAGLFVEPRKGVETMMGQLDGLLGDYLQRKGIVLS